MYQAGTGFGGRTLAPAWGTFDAHKTPMIAGSSATITAARLRRGTLCAPRIISPERPATPFTVTNLEGG